MNINSENRFSGLFPDLNLNSEITYYIKCNNSNDDQISHPNFGWHSFNSLNNSLTANGNNIITPTSWALYKNYPNPFNLSTILSYILHKNTFATISIFDMYYKIIKTLFNNKILVFT